MRACIGAGIGLTLCTFLVRLTTGGTDDAPDLLLIAPLGATAMLAFAVPSSPLAQPWSALVGNTVSAMIGVTVVLTIGDPWLAMGLSVTLAMMAMMVLRATHPPAAGVALGVVLTADTVREVGFAYAFSPVMLDTGLLLIVAMIYNRMTGRVYPFRQPQEHVPNPTTQAGLRPAVDGPDLTRILQRLGLDANIGAGDLARLIAAAHAHAAAHLFDGVAAGQVMARGVISAHPQMPVRQIAALFRQHKVRTLPVVGFDGVFQGLISEADLVRTWADAKGRTPVGMMSRVLRASRDVVEPVAAEVMARGVATAMETTPLGVLLDLLADGAQQAVPVLDAGRLIGLVTRADVIAALARAHHVGDDTVRDTTGTPDAPQKAAPL
jgi:CBS domain-containing membrane protein